MTAQETAARVAALLQEAEHLSRHAICLDLSRIASLLARLGHPERTGRFLHVAGTNGKGSTVACLEAILARAGYATFAYTSPHLQRFHERLRFRGHPISDDALLPALEESMARGRDLAPTFFELTTAAAFVASARDPVDWRVLEVGLGGRLDATNVITPRLALITPIGLDHTDWLGPDLAAIAREKAGIVKAGVPVVADPGGGEAQAVIAARAETLGAPVLFPGRDYLWERKNGAWLFSDTSGEILLPPPGMPGLHQYGNAALAVAGVRELERRGELLLPRGALEEGVAHYFLPGRLERVGRDPDLWLDGAHNPHAAHALASSWQRMAGGETHLLMAMVADKDADAVAAALAPLATRAWVTVTGGARAGDPQALAACLAARGVATQVEEEVATALERALAALPRGGRLLVTGSLYLVGAVRTLILPAGALQ